MIILDLDNCIYDDAWRIKFIDHSKPIDGGRYNIYHGGCHLDYFCGQEFVGKEGIVIFTARPEKFREKTIERLHQDGISFELLLMRDDDDHRHSVELKEEMLHDLPKHFGRIEIEAAYDDRDDVLEMYRRNGINAIKKEINSVSYEANAKTAADILVEMANTYRERNAVYGNNYKRVGKLMAVLFPDGVPPEILHSDQFHLFELILVKLSRFAISGLQHQDSIHDSGVYSAMIEAIILEGKKK